MSMFRFESRKQSIANAFYWEMKRNPYKYPALRLDGNILLSTQKTIEEWAAEFSGTEFSYLEVLEVAKKVYYNEKKR